MFSLLEYELGIIVACLPALRALIKHMLERDPLRESERSYPSMGSSPELKPESWGGDGALMYGGRNEVVIIGGYAKD